MLKDEIKLLRDEIDNIDNELLKLLIKRTDVVDKIGIHKQNSENIVDKTREAEVILRLLKLHKGNFSRDSLVRIWREIFHTSANIQKKNNNFLKTKRGVDTINLYTGGVSKIKGIENVIKLSSNESPFGPSPIALKAYEQTSSKLSRYPELTADSLQQKISEKFNLNPNQIISGTGSDEILIFTVLTFCSPGDEIIHAKHGFEMYPIITKYVGAESVLASEIDFKIDINSVIDNINQSTKIILIANPNNPTGTYLNYNELRSLIKKIPSNVVIVIDTAYAEFADAKDYDNTFSLADEYSNVLITRTFSKAYSLAGLRLGWAYGSESLINMIKKIRPPFNLPHGTIAAGIAALSDDNHLQKVIKHNSQIKPWFIKELNNLGLKAYNTQANFIFVIIPENEKQSAKLINDYLLSKGIAVRFLQSYGLEQALRITIGTKEELDKILKELKEFIKNNK